MGAAEGRRLHRRVVLSGIAVSAARIAPARADSLPPPQGPVLLTVTGHISHTTSPGRAEFDRAALEALGLQEISTSTAWTDGVSRFRGPLLRDVLDRVGAKGTGLIARAINDYSVRIPIEDCRKYRVLLALTRDGRELQRRDKGPIWVVYPRDEHPELRSELINARWIWQLDRLDVT
jgi:hypothetical protein